MLISAIYLTKRSSRNKQKHGLDEHEQVTFCLPSFLTLTLKKGSSLLRWKEMFKRHTQHILFTVIWHRIVVRTLFDFRLDYNDSVLMVNASEGRKDMFYLMIHSTHFIYNYITLDIG